MVPHAVSLKDLAAQGFDVSAAALARVLQLAADFEEEAAALPVARSWLGRILQGDPARQEITLRECASQLRLEAWAIRSRLESSRLTQFAAQTQLLPTDKSTLEYRQLAERIRYIPLMTEMVELSVAFTCANRSQLILGSGLDALALAACDRRARLLFSQLFEQILAIVAVV